MAIDIVPRKATGAALGVVGISSYMTIGLQNIISGLLIDRNMTAEGYNFTSVAIFWLLAVLLSFAVPILNWKKLKIGSTTVE
jgi:OPA family sugar phosphate sensor protein UhpC-like MFS transporter